MTECKRRLLTGFMVALIAIVVALQVWVSPDYDKIQLAGESKTNSNSGDMMAELPGQFVVASFTGFRQVIAGALWVRADEFFHSGRYQEIIPIVRIVTWLDPHNIDVYTTGAWHLDYNFVDEANSLSDKRYIPASIALMKEGIKNNPQIWDLYFELGWTHYSKKLMDNEKALECIEQACEHGSVDPNTGKEIPRPEFVDRMLAHSLEKCGRFEDAIAQWDKCREGVIKAMAANKKKPGSACYTDSSSLDLCDRNESLMLLRLGWRYARMDYYERGLKMAERLTGPPDWVEATKSARKDFESRKGKRWVGDAQKPLDAKFQVSWMRAAPQVLLIKGTLNLAAASEYQGLASESFTHWYKNNSSKTAVKHEAWRDGSRVYWRIQDYDYKMPDLDSFSWKTDLNQTVAWGDIYIGGGTFSSRIDMSDPRDREMYPFKAEKYKLTIWVTTEDPGVPDFIQDRIGWKGEALTDKSCLDTTTHPGYKMLRKEFILKRSDII